MCVHENISLATSSDWESVCADCGEVMASHGGKREGAGRKPREDGKGRTVPKSIKVSRDVADYLSERGTGIVEDMIRRSAAFRSWLAERPNKP